MAKLKTASANAANSVNSQIAGIMPHRFKKGQSGNPSGRPKKNRDVETIALDSADAAMRTLVELMKADDGRVRLAAAQAVLDRAVGKPKQAVDLNNKKDAVDYTEAELLAIARMGSQRADPSEEGEGELDSVH